MNPNMAYSNIPKPRKPIRLERKSIGFSKKDQAGFIQKIEYLMEQFKFMPDYERKSYAGLSEAEILESMKQYGFHLDENNNVVTDFGDVTRSMQYGQARAAGKGYGVEGLQLADSEAAGDFEHISDAETLLGEDAPDFDNSAVSNISSNLWETAVDSLKDEPRSFYEIMMEDGLDDKSPKECAYLMVVMNESRQRVLSTMESIFGAIDAPAAKKQEVFDEFVKNNEGIIEPGQLGFLQFFLDTQQSFISHIMPLFGGTTNFIASGQDKQMSEDFYANLSKKVATYLGINSIEDINNMSEKDLRKLTPEKLEIIKVWNEWVNPELKTRLTNNNDDPMDEDWSAPVYAKLEDDVDRLVQLNLFGRIISKARAKKYKEDIKEYDDKIEQEMLDDVMASKQAAKRKAEDRAFQAKSSQNARASARSGFRGTSFKSSVANIAKAAKRVAPPPPPPPRPKPIRLARPSPVIKFKSSAPIKKMSISKSSSVAANPRKRAKG